MIKFQLLMQPPEKKLKLQIKTFTMKTDELISFRNEIKKINEIKKTKEEVSKSVINEMDENTNDYEHDRTDDIKEFIRYQIGLSEKRINIRLDKIESKINKLLEIKSDVGSVVIIDEEHNDESFETDHEEHIIEEYVNENENDDVDDNAIDEYSSDIFPISDESSFDWFFARLKDDSFRANLVNQRWELTKNVGLRSFNVSVKDFIRFHFNLAVCTKYSVSGYGGRGSKKKKFDSQTLTSFIHDCFEKSYPGIHTMQDVSKAITTFWGRSQDTFNKSILLKKEREIPGYTVSEIKL